MCLAETQPNVASLVCKYSERSTPPIRAARIAYAATVAVGKAQGAGCGRCSDTGRPHSLQADGIENIMQAIVSHLDAWQARCSFEPNCHRGSPLKTNQRVPGSH